MINNSFINKYFSNKEMSCNCGCGLANVNIRTLKKLHRAREMAGVTFPVNSWCRCPKHNKAIGGRENSAHLRGTAIDIRVNSSDSHKRFKIIEALIKVGFNRIGVYDWGIHVDDDQSLPKEQIWKG